MQSFAVPCKASLPDFLVYPCRRRLFQLSHHVRQAMAGLERHQQMNMIGGAAYALGEATQPANRFPHIFMKTGTPWYVDRRNAVFRSEDEMIMKAEKGGRHRLPLLAPLRGAIVIPLVSRWYRPLSRTQPPANGFEPSGFASDRCSKRSAPLFISIRAHPCCCILILLHPCAGCTNQMY